MPAQFIKITPLRIAFASDNPTMLILRYRPFFAMNDFGE